MDFLEARARQFGRIIGVKYGEGYSSNKAIKVDSLNHLI